MPKHRRKVSHVIETNVGLTDSFDTKREAIMFYDTLVRNWKASAGQSVSKGFIWTSLYKNKILAMKIRYRKVNG